MPDPIEKGVRGNVSPGDQPPFVALGYVVSGEAFTERFLVELGKLGFEAVIWPELTDQQYRRKRPGWSTGWMRIRMYMIFPLRLAAKALWSRRLRHGILLVPTTPFFLPAMMALILRPVRTRVVQLLYDLYPDMLYLAGKIRPASPVAPLFSMSTRLALRHCAATVFLGTRLREEALRRYGPARTDAIIEVGADGSLFPGELAPAGETVRVLYAGNMGYAHEVETLTRAAREPLPPNLEIVFHSSGAGFQRFKEAVAPAGVPPRGIVLRAPLDVAGWATAMCAAQVALVTMRPGAEDILFPSKSYSALVAGQAILAVCPANSDLAAMVRDADCGWTVIPGDVEGLRRALETIAGDPAMVMAKRRRAQALGRTRYDTGILMKKWLTLFSHLGISAGPGKITP